MTGLSFLLVTISALFFPGIISITKAKLSGRKGPTLFQPIYDIGRLLRKSSVYSHTVSAIFRIAPSIYLASIVIAIAFIPFGGNDGLFSFTGDFVFFAYLLGLGKFMMIIGAMDTGSGFEGMGANREAFYSMLIEPAFFILMASLSLMTNHTTFSELYHEIHPDEYLSLLLTGLCIYVLIQVAMIENSRMPVDDPKTHLELTMVHEVMVLDNSGFDLGLIHIAGALKLSLYGALIANFFISPSQGLLINSLIFIGVQVLIALSIGVLESFRARNKMGRNPQWILTLSSIALVAFFTALLFTHKFILN